MNRLGVEASTQTKPPCVLNNSYVLITAESGATIHPVKYY